MNHILCLKTNEPTAEIGIYNAKNKLDYYSWGAHLQLAETIHIKIKYLLEDNNLKFTDLSGIIVYHGPGSFTGLRIGISTANALANSLNIPIVGTTGDDWLETGINSLLNAQDQRQVVPFYGAPVHITTPKK